MFRKTHYLVDDHPDNNSIPRRLLEEGGATVITALSTGEVIRVLRQRRNTVHLIISDMERGDDQLAGLRVLEYLHNAAIKAPAIIYSDNPIADACREEIRRLGGIGPILGPKSLIERVSCLFGSNHGDVKN